ncbi:transcriptional regulator, DeoR family [Cohaesibacter sp. ES.047]|uniref:DeoR/GlpR family DNA-binding transcription regulator n=1 Tax=Cohaesibacter sp. ES.047 TaxID=1798205 RepID=UPI000BB7CB9F|nr:DeoR/GlpR family DNA-binding transcription regulator [Cohaesibacter sp. ES.047]SNY92887.1 transcriptional regulator, DeoR family [Cohaesibacter sp. ES.047]
MSKREPDQPADPSRQEDTDAKQRLKAEDRRQQILSMVQAQKTVQLDQLAKTLDVSRMTVHRDLDLLESRGLLRKERGGATAESSLLFESNFHYRSQTDESSKRNLAREAAELIEPGSVVMLDDSTTTLMMCQYIKQIDNVTVISNSLAVCEQLRSASNVKLIITGGNYSETHQSFSGIICEQGLGQLRSDWAFLSASSVIDNRLYHQDQEIVRVKLALMAASERKALLLTSRKFQTRALTHFADLTEFDKLFIDRQLDEATKQRLTQSRIDFDLV